MLEVEQWRPVARSEMKMELHEIPVLAFAWCAEALRDLRPGTSVTLVCHLSGTRYDPGNGSEIRHGVQLVCDEVSFSAPYRSPVPALREAEKTVSNY